MQLGNFLNIGVITTSYALVTLDLVMHTPLKEIKTTIYISSRMDTFLVFILLASYAHIAISIIPATPVRLLLYQLLHVPWKHANLKVVLNLHGHLPS